MASTPRAQKQSTPLAIIDAAERLFGDFGIEGVSIRQIGLEAKAANKSAVSYHFGDRADLVMAIWAHRLPVLEQRRQELLAELQAEGKTADGRAVLRALLLPNYELVDAAGRRRYAAFFGNVMRWREGQALRAKNMALTPASAEVMAMLDGLASDIPHDLLRRRLHAASSIFFDMIVERDRDLDEGLPVLPEPQFLEEAYDMAEAVCLRECR